MATASEVAAVAVVGWLCGSKRFPVPYGFGLGFYQRNAWAAVSEAGAVARSPTLQSGPAAPREVSLARRRPGSGPAGRGSGFRADLERPGS
jgi:hypothetical protein